MKAIKTMRKAGAVGTVWYDDGYNWEVRTCGISLAKGYALGPERAERCVRSFLEVWGRRMKKAHQEVVRDQREEDERIQKSGGALQKKPFGQYSSFDACVRANSDKGDPEAYCADIMRQILGCSEDGVVEKANLSTMVAETKRDMRLLWRGLMEISRRERDNDMRRVADRWQRWEARMSPQVDRKSVLTLGGNVTHLQRHQNPNIRRFANRVYQDLKALERVVGKGVAKAKTPKKKEKPLSPNRTTRAAKAMELALSEMTRMARTAKIFRSRKARALIRSCAIAAKAAKGFSRGQRDGASMHKVLVSVISRAKSLVKTLEADPVQKGASVARLKASASALGKTATRFKVAAGIR